MLMQAFQAQHNLSLCLKMILIIVETAAEAVVTWKLSKQTYHNWSGAYSNRDCSTWGCYLKEGSQDKS